jgi:hypothetical protein
MVLGFGHRTGRVAVLWPIAAWSDSVSGLPRMGCPSPLGVATASLITAIASALVYAAVALIALLLLALIAWGLQRLAVHANETDTPPPPREPRSNRFSRSVRESEHVAT